MGHTPVLRLTTHCSDCLSMNPDTLYTLERSSDGGIGVAKTIRVPGDGDRPQMGDKVKVKYIGMLDDGTVFATSQTKLNPSGEYTITLGMREMWGTGGDLGLVSMREGERCMLTCHSEFAYGDQGVSSVNSSQPAP